MIERLEVLVGVCVVALALSVSTAVGIGGGSMANSVRSNLPFMDSESTEASEPGPPGFAAVSGGDETPDTSAHETADVAVTEDGDQAAAGCVEALTGQAESQEQLEAHVADGEKPAGGVSGNQNALDSQCGGALAAETAADAAPDPAQTDPGKSEQAPGDPTAGGNASGQGQANADANGSGPAGAPGHNKPQ